MKIAQSIYTTLKQERAAPEMCRRRHIRLRPRMGHIQRREGTEISPRKREGSTCTKEAVLTGLQIEIFREARRGRVKDNIGCYKEERTYIRGGARDIKMAKASRRFAAGERAISGHKKKKIRRVNSKTMGRVQGLTPRIKCPGKTKITKTYLRAFVTLSSPHDQRRQRGGRQRERGGSRGGQLDPAVYTGRCINASVGIPTPGRRRKLGG